MIGEISHTSLFFSCLHKKNIFVCEMKEQVRVVGVTDDSVMFHSPVSVFAILNCCPVSPFEAIFSP